MLSALVTQRVDIVLSGMTDTAERQKSVIFVDYFTSGPQFYTLRQNTEINHSSELCGKSVGASRRTTFVAEIAQWSKAQCEALGKPAVKVMGTEGSADARAQLRQGRVDAAVQGSETLPYLNQQEQNTYKTLGEPFAVQLTGLGISKNNPALANAIKAALQAMVADGSYQALLEKWDLGPGAVATVTLNNGK
ncbi:Cystine-binding periplasmic protein precursor [compost metagenome]